jgi:hypothetical protein
MTVTTRGDIKISAVDLKMADMFDPKRFQECNKRILDYFGISVAFVPSVMADVNNAIASVSTKPFQESIQTDRKIFEKFVQPFFEEINRKNNYNEIPSIEYDINGLNSDELLKVLQFLFNCGVVSYQDLCSLHGYDYEEQLVKKEWDQEHKFVIRPWFEASQGLLQDEEQAKIDNGENNKSDLKNQKKISAPKNNQT